MAYNPDQPVSKIKNNGNQVAEVPQSMQPVAGFSGMTPAVAREVATIQGQIMLAKMFPRNMADVWKKVEAACSRKKLAENALYQYSRGGTDISGPSIRLAEALINAYGNAKSGFEVIDSNPDFSRVRAYAYDMETNTLQERTFDVEHVRQTRTGRTKLTDPRDIYETVANNASRRERACILALIPGDLQDYAVSLCKTTLEQAVDITPDKIEGLCRGLAKYGVSRIMIEARIQRHMEAITAQQYVWLCSVGTSLKEGVAKVEDFFDRDAKPIGEPEVASSSSDKKTTSRKPATKVQQKSALENHVPEPENENHSIPDEVLNGQQITSNGEIIDEEANGPESFQDDSMEDFFDHD